MSEEKKTPLSEETVENPEKKRPGKIIGIAAAALLLMVLVLGSFAIKKEDKEPSDDDVVADVEIEQDNEETEDADSEINEEAKTEKTEESDKKEETKESASAKEETKTTSIDKKTQSTSSGTGNKSDKNTNTSSSSTAGNTSNKDTGKNDNQTSSSGTQKPSSNTGSESASSSNSHKHDWVAVTTTVDHPEEGHNEQYVVKEAWTETVTEPVYETRAKSVCNQCGIDITNAIDAHFKASWDCGGYHTEYYQLQTGTTSYTIDHPAEYGTRWVVDKDAWTETVTTGYKCSCGATK